MDSKKGTILVMIDMSSVFDTIHHSILLSKLELRYGITSVVLEWFRSYLYGKVQRINSDDSFSPPHPLTTGVSQGSVLGPLLFSLYVKPLGRIIREHLYIQSLHPAWTTEILCWLALQYRILLACKDHRTPQQDVY